MKSLEDLDEKELYRSAIEDFAIPVDANDKKEVLLAAFLEAGFGWSDYVKLHPEVAPEEEVAAPSAVVTSADVTGRESIKQEQPTIRVQEQPVVNRGDMFLIKMVRDNVRYDTCGHSFTQEHPYALVSPEDAQFILAEEDGFRQAFPNELAEFYS